MAGDSKNPRPDRGDGKETPVTEPAPALSPEEDIPPTEPSPITRLKRTVSSTVLRADDILEALKKKTSRPPNPDK